jgi:tRNA (cmo5U34)-methyltransferase
MKKNNKGKIYATLSNWSFEGPVVKKFDTHINKSIPLYKETHNLFVNLSDFFLQNNSKIIDLGCSTGTFLRQVYSRHKKNKKKLQYIGIDSVPEMIKAAKSKIDSKKIKFFCKNFLTLNLKKSCIISSMYTIQFISPALRQKLINKIYTSLNWGGAFFFVEKVRSKDARFQDYLTQTYLEYKLQNGHTPYEIINKSKSLKGVMEPFSSKGNIDMLKRAGFKDIETVFKYGCFEGFLAIK